MILKSKNSCPNCGGKEWRPYLFCDNGKVVVCTSVNAIVDKPTRGVDECLGCGIAVSAC